MRINVTQRARALVNPQARDTVEIFELFEYKFIYAFTVYPGTKLPLF